MLFQFVDRKVWLAADVNVIAEQINEGETPRSVTIKALEAGGMAEDEIEAEMADWVD